MKTKKVIQRALPLTVKYSLVSVNYLSLENGGGCSCDNCGKLITNVATVKSDRVYNTGLDCLETVLLNNQLLDNDSHVQYLFSDKPAIAKAKSLRAKLLNGLKKDPTYKAIYSECTDGRFGFSYEVDRLREYKYNAEKKELEYVEPYLCSDPQGFDYTFNPAYKELTLNYVKGLPNVIMP